MDPGDEDDGPTRPNRALWVALAGTRFMLGPTRVFYAAIRIPSEPDHDPGDEEPRLRIHPKLLGYDALI